MKGLGEHKWLVIVGAVAVLLSVGAIAWSAVAWTTANDDEPGDLGRVAPPLLQKNAGGPDQGKAGTPGRLGALKERREQMQERRESGVERLMTILGNLRDEMSAEDQAMYDELVETFKDQRESVQAAQQGLADTLKELRALVAKYLEPDSAGTAE